MNIIPCSTGCFLDVYMLTFFSRKKGFFLFQIIITGDRSGCLILKILN